MHDPLFKILFLFLFIILYFFPFLLSFAIQSPFWMDTHSCVFALHKWYCFIHLFLLLYFMQYHSYGELIRFSSMDLVCSLWLLQSVPWFVYFAFYVSIPRWWAFRLFPTSITILQWTFLYKPLCVTVRAVAGGYIPRSGIVLPWGMYKLKFSKHFQIPLQNGYIHVHNS